MDPIHNHGAAFIDRNGKQRVRTTAQLVTEREALLEALVMIASACAPGSAVEHKAEYAQTVAKAAIARADGLADERTEG